MCGEVAESTWKVSCRGKLRVLVSRNRLEPGPVNPSSGTCAARALSLTEAPTEGKRFPEQKKCTGRLRGHQDLKINVSVSLESWWSAPASRGGRGGAAGGRGEPTGPSRKAPGTPEPRGCRDSEAPEDVRRRQRNSP